jgi:hypothetical protein
MVLAGCTANGAEPGGVSRVEELQFPYPVPPRVDLVVVLADTPALAAHGDALTGGLASWQQELAALDARVVVVATSQPGELRVGSAGDLPALLAIGSAAGTGEVLAAVQAAVTSPEVAALRRPDDLFGVTIVAGADDSSPGAVADYAAAIAPLRPYVVVLAPDPPSRLTTFADAFPNRGSFDSIDAASYVGDDLAPEPPDRPVVDPCFDVAVEPATCVVTLGDATLAPPAYTLDDDNCLRLHVPPPATTVEVVAECLAAD